MAKKSSPAVPKYTVENILLFKVEGSQTTSDSQSEDTGRYMAGSVRLTEQQDDELYVNVTFDCGRKGNERLTELKFSATYGMLITCRAKPDSDGAILAAKDAARTVAWTHFANLFYMCNGQMRSRLPPLPANPEGLEIEVLGTLVTE